VSLQGARIYLRARGVEVLPGASREDLSTLLAEEDRRLCARALELDAEAERLRVEAQQVRDLRAALHRGRAA
jgi:hypothetical protein